MKKIIIILIVFCLGVPLFAQTGGIDMGLGFQYGTARVFDEGEDLREITQPGLVISFRLATDTIGFFGRLGIFMPSIVTEGELELKLKDYDYILFLNPALGVSFKAPINNQISFIMDVGLSFNTLTYGGSFTDTIDARWEVKIQQMGVTYRGGAEYTNVKMKDSYTDMGVGLFGNAAMRFNFTPNVYLELAAAASFDFLRFKTWTFSADFSQATRVNGPNPFTNDTLKGDFPGAMVDDVGLSITLDTTSDFSLFKQWTFIPSISIGYTF